MSLTALSSQSAANFHMEPITQASGAPPLVMLVMSRDEQLYNKAYSDYTDLDNNGVLDTTYSNSFDYIGYFDPQLCYTYDTTNNYYKVTASATSHQCSGTTWSGNFLNWAAMSRLDLLRYVLYGGYRNASLTNGDTTNNTILERAYVPDDAHSWAKVYSSSDVNKYTPYTGATISLCNSTQTSTDSASDNVAPTIRVANGSFTEWAATEGLQCQWRGADTGYAANNKPSDTANNYSAISCPTGYTCATNSLTGQTSCPTGSGYTVGTTAGPGICIKTGSGSSARYAYTSYSYTDKLGEFTARVKVCDSTATAQESFCRTYTDSTNATHLKPAGLLQKFGESGQLRFGLMTGSYAKPRSGGKLRRNIGLLAGNVAGSSCGSGSGDEINLTTGVFCTNGTEGIIKTLNLLHQPGWTGSNYAVKYSGVSGNSGGDCPQYGILNRDGVSGNSQNALLNPGTSTSNDYNCAGWGNPLAEIYAEALRYIEGNGKTPSTAFAGDDTKYLSGIPNGLSWTDPYTLNNWCASCSIIVLSTGLDSFDTDELPTDLGFSAATTTDSVGANEGINGSSVIIGRVNALSNSTYADLCSAQTVGALSQAIGICPEIPSLEGGFDIAGLAWKAWTTDLRSDLSSSIAANSGAGKPSNYVNKVQTYAIALAENLPSYKLKLSGGTITLSPLCQANTTAPANTSGPAITAATAGWRSCGFLSLTVGKRTSLVSPNFIFGRDASYDGSGNQLEGSFSVAWEDSQWGNDHDIDGSEMLSFCVGSTCSTATNGQGASAKGICWNVASSSAVCDGSGNIKSTVTVDGNTLLVRIEPLSVYAGNSMLLGFSTSGASTSSDSTISNANGAHRLFVRPGCSDNNDDSLLTKDSAIPTTGNFASACAWGTPQVVKFTGGAATASSLQNPLFYAAKYGGFTGNQSLPSAPTATDTTDWDKINNDTGVAPGDGVPDNFYRVRNPAQLIKQLSKVFQDILRTTGSGTAAAVVANQREGDGATYQALYIPTKTDNNDRVVTWLGTVQSLFVDSKGYLREDGNGDATLQESNYSTDPVVDVFYDTTDKTTKVRRYSGDPAAVGTTSALDDLDKLHTVWNARDPLAQLTNAQVASNRTYSSSADTGRYIFTFVDKNLNGVVDTQESVPFDLASFKSGTNNTWGLLNVGDETSAQNVISYTRGQDINGLRSRTIDYKNDGNLRTYRLGDIVNSTPTVVGTPAEAFDLLYNDTSYSTFRKQYQFRRNVLYVGANDGMLHAFNGGFYNANLKKFQTTPIDSTTATAHPLGTELWAYVPFNLLPHLIWLTSPNYSHVYYFDGTPRVFDMRIFPTDDDHPGGWGTVMVVGMRFGGGDLDLPVCTAIAAFSGFSSPDGTTQPCPNGARVAKTDIYTHSAYVIMDITNPEKAPTLLAELGTDPTSTTADFGFTTSYPTGMAFSAKGGSTTDTWYLTFGNGPTDLGSASASARPKLYIYKMASSGLTAQAPLNLATTAGFTGDPVSVDWNLDFKADDLYVGTASGTPTAPGGQLMKIDTKSSADTSTWVVSTLANPGMPILETPAVALDKSDQHWVYAGSGRLYVGDDKKSTVTQQSLFGVIDGTTAPDYSTLINVGGGLVKQSDSSISGVSGSTTESALESAVQTAHGWKISLKLPASGAATSAERVLSSTGVIGNTLFATAYTPDTSLCTGAGTSRLFALNFITGVANPAITSASGSGSALPQGSLGTFTSSGTIYLNNSISLGAGLGAAPSLHADSTTGANGLVTVVTQTSTGAIVTNNAQVSPTEKNAEIDWRETLPNSDR